MYKAVLNNTLELDVHTLTDSMQPGREALYLDIDPEADLEQYRELVGQRVASLAMEEAGMDTGLAMMEEARDVEGKVGLMEGIAVKEIEQPVESALPVFSARKPYTITEVRKVYANGHVTTTIVMMA